MMAARIRASLEAPQGSAVFTSMLTGTDPLRGLPAGDSRGHRK